MDLAKPQLILSFDSRVNAEKALACGKQFKEKRLQIVWAPVVQMDAKMQAALANNREKLLKTSNELNKLAHLPEAGGDGERTAETEADPGMTITADSTVESVEEGVGEEGATLGGGRPVSVLSPEYTDVVTTDTTIPELRLEDEEEDEESEDRSWRR